MILNAPFNAELSRN